ncbi:MAG: hypothetical protein WKG07_10100 [Hymenobacter sp.]
MSRSPLTRVQPGNLQLPAAIIPTAAWSKPCQRRSRSCTTAIWRPRLQQQTGAATKAQRYNPNYNVQEAIRKIETYAALQRQPELLAGRRLRQLVGHRLRRAFPARSPAGRLRREPVAFWTKRCFTCSCASRSARPEHYQYLRRE